MLIGVSCFCLFIVFYFLLEIFGGFTASLWSGAGQQSGHQRQAEVCDGECSWCLSLCAGQSYSRASAAPQ